MVSSWNIVPEFNGQPALGAVPTQPDASHVDREHAGDLVVSQAFIEAKPAHGPPFVSKATKRFVICATASPAP